MLFKFRFYILAILFLSLSSFRPDENIEDLVSFSFKVGGEKYYSIGPNGKTRSGLKLGDYHPARRGAVIIAITRDEEHGIIGKTNTQMLTDYEDAFYRCYYDKDSREDWYLPTRDQWEYFLKLPGREKYTPFGIKEFWLFEERQANGDAMVYNPRNGGQYYYRNPGNHPGAGFIPFASY